MRASKSSKQAGRGGYGQKIRRVGDVLPQKKTAEVLALLDQLKAEREARRAPVDTSPVSRATVEP